MNEEYFETDYLNNLDCNDKNFKLLKDHIDKIQRRLILYELLGKKLVPIEVINQFTEKIKKEE